MTKAAR